MIVRWLQAYQKFPLYDCLKREFGIGGNDNPMPRIVAAEKFGLEKGPELRPPAVGLLVPNKYLVRKYRTDIYSVPTGKKGDWLKPTRLWQEEHKNWWCKYREVFVRPVFIGIIVKKKLNNEDMDVVRYFKDKIRVPVWNLRPETIYKETGSCDLHGPEIWRDWHLIPLV